MVFDKTRMAGALGDDGPADEQAAPEPVTVDPTVGRRRPSVPQRLTAGSVTWDPALLTKLRVTVAQEPGLTQRALNNELVRRFYALSAREQRPIIDAAKAWEKEQRP